MTINKNTNELDRVLDIVLMTYPPAKPQAKVRVKTIVKHLIETNGTNAQGQNEHAKILAACNPDTPMPVLLELVKANNRYVKSAALTNPNMPVDLLWVYATALNIPFQAAVASNVNVPVEILEHIIADKYAVATSATPKFLAAANPVLSKARLAELAVNSDPFIRAGVANNPNTDAAVISELLEDTDSMVVDYAQEKLDKLMVG